MPSTQREFIQNQIGCRPEQQVPSAQHPLSCIAAPFAGRVNIQEFNSTRRPFSALHALHSVP